VGAADLARILDGLPLPAGDAGVFPIAKNLSLVQAVDVSAPAVDDPYDAGRIAATLALGNIYALGATPITALTIAAFPIDSLDEAILRRILEGGAAVAAAAGVTILGSHIVQNGAPAYGLTVTGTVHPERIVRSAGARPGDQLLLTKPIGTGILTTARRRNGMPEADLLVALEEMTRLNDAARDAMLANGAHAAVAIGAFGLLGHAVQIARASHVGIEIESAAVPVFARVLELIDLDFVRSSTEANLTYHSEFTSYADYVTGTIRVALSDTTTSGGLLIAADPRDIRAMHAALAPTHRCAIVGRITEDGDGTISVL
jgi:selenide,water dikinase